MNCYYVYVLRDPRNDNAPFYVGKGKGERYKSHLNETETSTNNPYKWRKIEAIRQAGLEVVVEKYREGLAEEDAYALEADLIQQWGRKGYDDGGILTNVCVDARPPSWLGKTVTEETKEKIAAKQRGELNHRYGVSWSDEEKERRRQWALQNGILPPDHTGRKRSAETKEKQRQAALGKKKSPEHCKAIGLSKSGDKHPNWGKTLDEDLKAKIRAANVAADHPNKKANWDDVREIRLMSRLGHAPKIIQERFDRLSVATIRDIIAERTWKEEYRPD